MDIAISSSVQLALKENRPVVALESTILSFGLDYPSNFELALELEEILRSQGVVAATIAVIEGVVKVGLEREDYQFLTDREAIQAKKIVKAGARDLPFILAKKLSAATTVASTALLAHRAGVKFFATGGIGGVHRGEEFDISNDLFELSKIPIVVVSSGMKSILDVAKTLEYLETVGVGVCSYKSSMIPTFYSRESEFYSPEILQDVGEIVDILYWQKMLRPESALLVFNPIPVEDEIKSEQIEHYIQALNVEVQQKNIRGKDVTPYVLRRLSEVTGGKSVVANLSLIKNNVKLAGELAQKYFSVRV